MKRMMGMAFIVLFAGFVFFYSCNNDTNTQTHNISGKWMGYVFNGPTDGGSLIEFVFSQIDSTHFTGIGYPVPNPGGKDSITISGTVSGDQFTGTVMADCNMSFTFFIDTSDNKMNGSVAPKDSCHGAPEIQMFREISPIVNATGIWSGSSTGTDGIHTSTMTVNQIGTNLTGTILGGSDTNSVAGYVFGDAGLGIIMGTGTNRCDHVMFGTISNATMSGEYSFYKGTKDSSQCTDYGTFSFTKQ
jgi:hypothetical protein